MHRFDYTPADCQQFHQAECEICVPVYHQLNAERAEHWVTPAAVGPRCGCAGA